MWSRSLVILSIHHPFVSQGPSLLDPGLWLGALNAHQEVGVIQGIYVTFRRLPKARATLI